MLASIPAVSLGCGPVHWEQGISWTGKMVSFPKKIVLWGCLKQAFRAHIQSPPCLLLRKGYVSARFLRGLSYIAVDARRVCCAGDPFWATALSTRAVEHFERFDVLGCPLPVHVVHQPEFYACPLWQFNGPSRQPGPSILGHD